MRRFPDQLPAPVEQPPADLSALNGLSRQTCDQIDAVAAGRTPLWSGYTGTRVDVGLWFRKRRVCLVVFPGELVLLAHGVKPFVERAALEDLGESQYNAVTGELVLEPAPSLSLKRLVMSPVEGGQVLSQIGK